MIISCSAKETLRAGCEFGARLKSGDVVALCGDLGAGKTCFVKGVALALGAEDAVTSPTFTLVHEYRAGRLPLFHVDLYRLECERETVGIGLDEYLNGEGVAVVEWADKFRHLMPAGTRWIHFRALDENTREIREEQ
jgi:tRNA threonylcarbamoyladenosine biosynthesis protein TsaE